MMGTKFVKYEIEITQSVIDFAKKENLICAEYLKVGKWICVDVVQGGYKIPQTVSMIDTEEKAIRTCRVHNEFLGYTKEESDEIVSESMGLFE